MFTPELMKKTGSQRDLGLRGSEAPDQNKQDSRAPEKLIKGCKLAMLFYFNPKANLRKYSNFYFLKRCFYKFFSTLLVFHSYLEFIKQNSFINRDQWIRLIFDTVNDVLGFEG